jgi:hypothetical protein
MKIICLSTNFIELVSAVCTRYKTKDIVDWIFGRKNKHVFSKAPKTNMGSIQLYKQSINWAVFQD